jgi:hypothetical protein
MKKIIFASAIVLLCLNVTSCTRTPISENTELSTGGEEGNGNENPDDN